MAQFKCTTCNQEFDYPDFGPCKKSPGNHTVETKEYYDFGGSSVADVRDRRKFSPLITLVPGQDRWDESEKRNVRTEGLYVQFGQSGKFSTNDPKLQYYLELRGYTSGPEAYEKWCSIYLTPQQNIDRKQAQLEDMDRQIRERNTLLEETKAKLAKGAKG